MLLEVKNLNNRPYIHGSSLVEALLSFLRFRYGDVSDFNLRIHKPLHSLPDLQIYTHAISGDSCAAVGHFKHNTYKYAFSIVPSGVPCAKFADVGEEAISQRILRYPDYFEIADPSLDENVHLLWNALAVAMNKEFFLKYCAPDNRQLWLTGVSFDNLEFLDQLPKPLGLSTSFTQVAANCIKRDLLVKGQRVGTRTSVFA